MDSEIDQWPLGLIDLSTTAPLGRRWPTTWRGWCGLLVGTLICDVLRRCQYEDCWKHGRWQTLLSGRLCTKHRNEYYSGWSDAAD